MFNKPKHRRTQSDYSGPSSLSLQNQKSPEARFSGRFVMSPLSACQQDISHPQLLEDPEKLEQFSKEKLATIRMMYEEARREYDELKHEFQRKPSEVVHTNLETKSKVLRRLESQLSTYGFEPETPSGDKKFYRRGSSIESSPQTAAEGDASTRPPPMPSSRNVPRLKSSDSDAGMTKPDTAKSGTSLSRSHSDSYKRIKKASGDQLRCTASTDEIQRIATSASGEFEIGSHHDSESSCRSRSQEATSDDSSDPMLNRLAPLSEHPAPTSASSSFDMPGFPKQQSNIIALDDYEFGSDEENQVEYNDSESPFSDFASLKTRPAHLAVFLHYLISNSDASPLLFYMMSEPYSLGSVKELRKWAYEIFSTFLVDKAPLKVKVDESYLETIHDILINKYDKEDIMRTLFTVVRDKAVLLQINELLADFRSKRALGLGALYGENELRDGLDHAGELKIVESILWKHLERAAADDDNERDQVFASALATYFKQIGCTNVRSTHVLDRCQTFNSKDKPKFTMFGKAPKRDKSIAHRGHQLQPQHYFYVTNCCLCHSVLFGVGNQGYQCQKCDLNFHKSCLEKIKDTCPGKKSSKPQNMIYKLQNKKSITPAAEDQNEDELGHKDTSSKGVDKSETSKSTDDAKSLPAPDVLAPESLPTEENQQELAGVITFPPSYTSSLNFNVAPYPAVPGEPPPSYSSATVPVTESDMDADQDLPPLESIIAKEYLKKLDKREKKRQEVINELFHTEKTHLRDIKAMKLVFYVPMSTDPTLVELANFVFPCINEIVQFHSNLNNEFKRIRSSSDHFIVGDFAEVLVTYFSGEKGANFKRICGQFCEKQSQAQEMLKARQKKDPKLITFLQDASSNPICRRLTLKDFLPIPMQRLTKYPLLIENLIKYTPSESDEYARLRTALESSRDILFSVNKAVNDYENRQKLLEIHRKLDRRPIENSSITWLHQYRNLDVTTYTLLFDGPLMWRLSRDKLIPLQVVLLDSILLLLQKQDDKLVLRCESTLVAGSKEDIKRSPIIKLSNLIIRPVATDKCAFFLISETEVGPQIYELVCSSKDEKNKWWKHLTAAVEPLKNSNVLKTKPINNKKVHIANELERKHKELEDISDEDEGKQQNVTLSVDLVSLPDEHYHAESINTPKAESSRLSTASLDPLDQLRQVDEDIGRLMYEKHKILSRLLQEFLPGSEDKSEDISSSIEIILSTLTDTDQLMRLVYDHGFEMGNDTGVFQTPSPGVPGAFVLDADKLTPEGQLPISKVIQLNNSIHKKLNHLLENTVRNEQEKQRLMMDLHLAQEKLAALTLSNSDDQADRTPELTSEITSDLQERKIQEDLVPSPTKAKDFDSPVSTVGKNDIDASLLSNDVINENSFSTNAISSDGAENCTDV